MVGPTAQEQLMLEMMNRMRMNPAEELDLLVNSSDSNVNGAINYFNVDLTELANQWSTLTAAQPLAWSDQLDNAATGHGELMIQEDSQSHQLPGEAGLGQRITNAGYEWQTVGENIFAYAESVFYGHAGFAIDWGNTPTGIQTPAGHRNSIMNNGFREVGISILEENDSSTNVGPLVITQNFANSQDLAWYGGDSWLLGVVFDDLTVDDDFYSIGEGLNGITVTAVNQSDGSSFSTTSLAAGGYQMQLPDGTYDVTFSDANGGFSDYTATVSIGAENVKLDLATDTLTSPPNPTPIPTTGPDNLTGSSGDDTIKALSGNDTVNGADGNDTLWGQGGDDLLNGEAGNDKLLGGAGNDELNGGNDSDTLLGSNGNDLLNGNTGNDILNGGNGNDTLNGGDENDVLAGGANNDVLNGNAGADKLKGGKGDDLVNGGEGNDTLIGQDNNDALNGGTGNDLLKGGKGADTLIGADSSTGGTGERDILRGQGDADTFVLGDATQAYYTGSGSADLAIIPDFSVGEDLIQLHGSAADYQLQEVNGQHTKILLDGDLIGRVNRVTGLDISDSSVFNFV